jgi:hypothetical protein
MKKIFYKGSDKIVRIEKIIIESDFVEPTYLTKKNIKCKFQVEILRPPPPPNTF